MESQEARFTALFRHTYPAVCRFVAGMLQNPDTAQDVAQEAFLRLYRAGLDCIEPGQERFWVFRVARNLALNKLKKLDNRRRLLEFLPALLLRRNTTPEEELQGLQGRAILSRLIQELPPDRRMALLLREQSELSYREIARVMEVSESKVKVDIFRARTTLRRRWEKLQPRGRSSERPVQAQSR